MIRARVIGVLVVGLSGAAAAVVACGSSDDESKVSIDLPGDAGKTSDATAVSATFDAGPDDSGLVFENPDAAEAAAPVIVGTCTADQEGRTIEVGTDLNSKCDEIDLCQHGQLIQQQSASTGSNCPTVACPGDEDAGPGDAGCPAYLCQYAHSFCYCDSYVDGGNTYRCGALESAPDPAGRPRYGTSCDAGSSSSEIGVQDCLVGGTISDWEVCKNGNWQFTSPPDDVCGP